MLTDEQIQELYAYCKRKNILYYDIQVEIVDHMANAIEEKMQADTSLGFKQALEQVHFSFGSFGLRDIVSSKTAAMRKKYGRIQRRLFYAYFTFPKILLAIMLLLGVITVDRFLPEPFLAGAVIFIAIIALIQLIRVERERSVFRKSYQKKLLMTDRQFFDFSFYYLMVILQIVTGLFKNPLDSWVGKELRGDIELYGLTVILILYIINSLVKLAMLQDVHKEARDKYPAAFA